MSPISDRSPVRVALVGFGTVGRWLARAVATRAESLRRGHDASFCGPGAGTGLAGQGVLSDLLAVARSR